MNLKKPKFWDQKNPGILAYLLLPISIIINLLNLLQKKSKFKNLKIKTICVGNIYIGGTGKTSLCIKISKILNKENIKSCFVKKFYSNQTDEQKLLENHGRLFLKKKRLNALNDAVEEGYKIAIMDDGLQDASIDYDLKFVCFNNINWIGNGLTIPSGPLREKITKLKDYQNVFLNGNLENLENIKKIILKINSKINIHIGKYHALNIEEFDKKYNYIIFSGIGNHQTFVSMLKKYGLKVHKDIEFPDHYKYSNNDINKILKLANNNNCKVITTEKDYLRLNKIQKNQIQFIKSELKIIDEQKLINTILNAYEKN
jgi:tetraacyldisaccharide 4'-kinase